MILFFRENALAAKMRFNQNVGEKYDKNRIFETLSPLKFETPEKVFFK
jgi:hypothetical protein